MKPLALALLLLATNAGAETLPGYDRLTVTAPLRDEPVQAAVWYPAGSTTYTGNIGDNAVFKGSLALVGAQLAPGKYPLMVMSHGSGSNMNNMGWLAGALAEKGVIVLGVNHPGSTSGDSSPRRSVRNWERAGDISSAIDMILADPAFGPHIDPSRITVFGFSLGGATALHLSGARMSRSLYKSYCNTQGDAAPDCLFFSKGGVDLANLPAEYESDMRDPRISATIAVDPGMTAAIDPTSFAGMTNPTLLINLGTKGGLWQAIGVGPEGSNLIAHLPDAQYVEIAPAIHYTFLAECKPDAPALLIAEGEDPICDDPAGTNRAAVHRRIIDATAKFLLR